MSCPGGAHAPGPHGGAGEDRHGRDGCREGPSRDSILYYNIMYYIMI